ncbi:MAG: RHS repeat-associated core domain-containing protein [Bacteroidia bacterium]
MLEVKHQAGSIGWTRTYHYNEPSLLETGKVNNRLSKTTSPSVTGNLTYLFTHDIHGNMTSMAHLPDMQWDFADQLKAVQLNQSGDMEFYTYTIGGGKDFGVRTRKTTERGNKIYDRIYIAGGDFEIYRERPIAGGVDLERETLHIQDENGRLALIDTLTIDSGASATGLGVPIIRFQLSNHLGSASHELDEQGMVINYEEFYPFGSNSYRLGKTLTDVSQKRYRYVGKEKDESTGLYYYGARYYGDWMCRFVSVDDLKDEYPFYTPFQYAGNKPVIGIDIDGLESNLDIGQEKETSIGYLDNNENIVIVNHPKLFEDSWGYFHFVYSGTPNSAATNLPEVEITASAIPSYELGNYIVSPRLEEVGGKLDLKAGIKIGWENELAVATAFVGVGLDASIGWKSGEKNFARTKISILGNSKIGVFGIDFNSSFSMTIYDSSSNEDYGGFGKFNPSSKINTTLLGADKLYQNKIDDLEFQTNDGSKKVKYESGFQIKYSFESSAYFRNQDHLTGKIGTLNLDGSGYVSGNYEQKLGYHPLLTFLNTKFIASGVGEATIKIDFVFYLKSTLEEYKRNQEAQIKRAKVIYK